MWPRTTTSPARLRRGTGVAECHDTHQIEPAQVLETLAQKPRLTISRHGIQQHETRQFHSEVRIALEDAGQYNVVAWMAEHCHAHKFTATV